MFFHINTVRVATTYDGCQWQLATVIVTIMIVATMRDATVRVSTKRFSTMIVAIMIVATMIVATITFQWHHIGFGILSVVIEDTFNNVQGTELNNIYQ